MAEDELLEIDDEQIRYTAALSWWCFLRRFVIAGMLVVAGFWAYRYGQGSVLVHGSWLALAGILMVAATVIVKRSVTVQVTVKHVHVLRKLFSLHTVTLNLHRIESVDITQTLLQRILGYGDVVIRGLGNEDITLSGLSQPGRLKQEVLAGRVPADL